MESLQDRYRRLFVDGSNTDRLVFFSDAVFAIAMTLLVIDLHVPDDDGGTAWQVLLDEWPAFFAYALSFTIIAVNWVTHHRKFRVITTHDGTLMLLDLVLLFFVAFVPFPTSLLSAYAPEPAAVVLYAFVVGLLSVIQFAMWNYAWRKKLIDPGVDVEMYRYVRTGQLTTPVVFWLSIPIALFWSGEIAMYFWFLLFPANFVEGWLRNRSRDSASAAGS